MVHCRISSSKHCAYSSRRTWQIPVSLAWRCSSFWSSCSCRCRKTGRIENKFTIIKVVLSKAPQSGNQGEISYYSALPRGTYLVTHFCQIDREKQMPSAKQYSNPQPFDCEACAQPLCFICCPHTANVICAFKMVLLSTTIDCGRNLELERA